MIRRLLTWLDSTLGVSYVVVPGVRETMRLTKSEMAGAMERLKDNPDFSILRARWMQIRTEITERGKREKDDKIRADLFIELRGFDLAMREAFAWSNFFEDQQKKQDKLREALQRQHPTAHLEK